MKHTVKIEMKYSPIKTERIKHKQRTTGKNMTLENTETVSFINIFTPSIS